MAMRIRAAPRGAKAVSYAARCLTAASGAHILGGPKEWWRRGMVPSHAWRVVSNCVLPMREQQT